MDSQLKDQVKLQSNQRASQVIDLKSLPMMHCINQAPMGPDYFKIYHLSILSKF